jgi:hypothetical protein
MGSRRIRIGGASWGRLVLALALVAGGSACGGGEEKSTRVASMVAPVDPEAGGAASSEPPGIESIALDPARAVAGTRLRAKAKLRNTGGRKVSVDYRWQTSSGRVLGQGQELETAGLEPGAVIEVFATPRFEDETGEPFAHRFRLAAEASLLALVVIDDREGKRVGSLLRAVVETTEEEAGFDEVALEWRVGGETVGTEEELDTTPFQPGDVVELRAAPAAELAEGAGRPRPIHAEPIVLEPSVAPEITSQPASGLEGGLFRYAVRASSGARGAQLRYELLKGPEGMTVDPATGVVEWRPKVEQRGRFDVEVAVIDQWGSGVAQSFAIGAESKGAPPASAR